jgi:hypothetical protein
MDRMPTIDDAPRYDVAGILFQPVFSCPAVVCGAVRRRRPDRSRIDESMVVPVVPPAIAYGRRIANTLSHTASAGFGRSAVSTMPSAANIGRMEPGGCGIALTSRSVNVS